MGGSTMLHIRYNGESHEFNVAVTTASSDQEIKEAAAQSLEIPIDNLDKLVVDRRPNGDIMIHPEAIYG
jgi:hypothetical protein